MARIAPQGRWWPLLLPARPAARALLVGAALLGGAAGGLDKLAPAAEEELLGTICPGSVEVGGVEGPLWLLPAGWGSPNPPPNPRVSGSSYMVEVNDTIELSLGSRTYFADSCTAGEYRREEYSSLSLLGKTLQYTVNVSGAGCGCSAELSLVPMRQNKDRGKCGDFYCSSSQVCGVACAEISLQEANRHAWHSTIHAGNDHSGYGMGFGGGGRDWDGPRDFSSVDYAPGGQCIDTQLPFQVQATFPVDDTGALEAVEVVLSQGDDRTCQLKMSVRGYLGMEEVSSAIAEGVTPVISYWSGTDMQWLDGGGKDGRGPCEPTTVSACSPSVVFSDFRVFSSAEAEELPSSVDVHVAAHPALEKQCEEARGKTVVEQHGALRVRGTHVVGEHGRPVRLRGMSLFWSQWKSTYWNADVIRWLVKDWNVMVVRAAMAVAMGGYLMHPQTQNLLVETVIEACIAEGIYVIVDWHDYEAHKHVDQAKRFFEQVAKKYGQSPNVLFEPWNEPEEDVGWSETIKRYHDEVVPLIRKYSSNIVILGNRGWSQQPTEVVRDPVDGKNIVYTFHFWAASHHENEQKKLLDAVEQGVPLFVSEWGTSEYTGDGSLDLASARAWLSLLEQHHISDVNWAISDKRETASALVHGASVYGNWSLDELTESGRFIRESLQLKPLGNFSALRSYVPLRGDCPVAATQCEAQLSLTQCAELCSNAHHCVGFAYTMDGGRCALKASSCAAVLNNGYTFFEKSMLHNSPFASVVSMSENNQDAQRCLQGNDLQDGFEYVYNRGRGTDEAACGRSADYWCCRRNAGLGPLRELGWRLRKKGKGCRNYKDIGMNSGFSEGGVSGCAARCAAQVGCVGFGFQSSGDCGLRGAEVGYCMLWAGACDEEDNPCWDDYVMTAAVMTLQPVVPVHYSLMVSAGAGQRGSVSSFADQLTCAPDSPTGIVNSSDQEQSCLAGNSLQNGTGYFFNHGRGSAQAACAEAADCWCCSRNLTMVPHTTGWELRAESTGCSNRQNLLIFDVIEVDSLDTCGELCRSHRGCVQFAYSPPGSCGENSSEGIGLCSLLFGTCEQQTDECWHLYEMQAAPAANVTGLVLHMSGGQLVGPADSEVVIVVPEDDDDEPNASGQPASEEVADRGVLVSRQQAQVGQRQLGGPMARSGSLERWVRIFGGAIDFLTLLAIFSFARHCFQVQQENAAAADKANGGEGDSPPRHSLLPTMSPSPGSPAPARLAASPGQVGSDAWPGP